MEAFKCCDKCTICKGNLDSSLFTVHFMPPPVLSMFAKRTHAIAEKLRVGGPLVLSLKSALPSLLNWTLTLTSVPNTSPVGLSFSSWPCLLFAHVTAAGGLSGAFRGTPRTKSCSSADEQNFSRRRNFSCPFRVLFESRCKVTTFYFLLQANGHFYVKKLDFWKMALNEDPPKSSIFRCQISK